MRYHFFIICCLIIVSTIFNNLGAQCIADAGPSKKWCRTVVVPRDTVILGGNYDTIADLSQYVFAWYIKPISWAGGLTFHASIFLNDTTIPNPTLVDGIGDSMKFYLQVSKVNGPTCVDSTVVDMALFLHLLHTFTYNIPHGKSVKLQPSIIVNENSQGYPDSVQWFPNKYLNDHKAFQPICTPDSSIQYRCYAWFKGCLDTTHYFQYVNVVHLGDDEITPGSNSPDISVYPNPAILGSSVLVSQDVFLYEFLEVYSISGRKIFDFIINSSELQLKEFISEKGSYIFKFSDKEGKYPSQSKYLIFF